MTLTIDCGTCSRQDSSSCQDCVVTFIVSRQPDDAVIVDAVEFAAVRRLQRAGLVPDLLHDGDQSATGTDGRNRS